MKKLCSLIILASFCLSLLLGFQNCSSSHVEFEMYDGQSLLESFDYRYLSKPSYFFDAVFMLDGSPNPSDSFKVLAFVGQPSTTQAGGTLTIQVYNENNVLICPTETITLTGGSGSAVISCIPPTTFSTATVKFKVTGSPSGDMEISKSY